MEEKPRTIKIYFCFLKREKDKVEPFRGVLPGPGWRLPGRPPRVPPLPPAPAHWWEPASQQPEGAGGGTGGPAAAAASPFQVPGERRGEENRWTVTVFLFQSSSLSGFKLQSQPSPWS